MKKSTIFGSAALLIVVASVTWIAKRFRQDLSTAERRIKRFRQLVSTTQGVVEFGDIGRGPAVLVIHGAGQGFDQGLWMAEQNLEDDFRIIAPSRFGYLGSPVPKDSSIEAQADLYASLLKKMGIDQVAVVAVSAGGPSALQFAVTYPERTKALILVSAISFTTETTMDAQKEALIYRLIGSDFVYWLSINFARPLVLKAFGVDKALQAELGPDDWALADAALNGMLPISCRLAGIRLDSSYRVSKSFPLARISAPTLVLHARDDSLVPYDRAQHSANNIPDARLVSFETGGHLSLGRTKEIQDEIKAFLEKHIVK